MPSTIESVPVIKIYLAFSAALFGASVKNILGPRISDNHFLCSNERAWTDIRGYFEFYNASARLLPSFPAEMIEIEFLLRATFGVLFVILFKLTNTITCWEYQPCQIVSA